MAIDKKLIDQLLTDYKRPEDIIGENGLLKELTKAILERALEAEMTDHLGYGKHDPAGHHRGNTRNGKSQKTLKGEFGELALETPRDRKATFDPARDDYARDPGSPGGNLWHRGFADPDLQRDRCGDRGGEAMAGTFPLPAPKEVLGSQYSVPSTQNSLCPTPTPRLPSPFCPPLPLMSAATGKRVHS